jgi:hypothetical protein
MNLGTDNQSANFFDIWSFLDLVLFYFDLSKFLFLLFFYLHPLFLHCISPLLFIYLLIDWLLI